MNIKSIVIHELKKDGKSNGEVVDIELSIEKYNIDEKITDTLNKLNESFNNKSPSRGKLNDDGFQRTIGDFESIDLLKNSKELMGRLKDKTEGTLAKGGYLVFCEYEAKHKFLSVFLLRNTIGAIFKRVNGSFVVEDSTHLDVEKFAMGVRINLTLLNDKSDDRYVQLSRGNTDISNYFKKWVGLTEEISENKDVDALLEITKTLPRPDNMDRDGLLKVIHDFAKTKPNKTLNIRELSGYIYDGDEECIDKHISKMYPDIDMDSEFKLKGTNLGKFYKVSAKGDGIELSAKRDLFRNRELISINGNTVIIHSEDLASKIQRQLSND